jgi:hypothetical protein
MNRGESESNELHASIDTANSSAAIGNGLVEMRFDWRDGLRLRSLVHENTGVEWVAQRPTGLSWGTDDHHPALVTDRNGLWPELAPPSGEFLVVCSGARREVSISAAPAGGDIVSERRTFTGRDIDRIDVAQSRAGLDANVARLDLAMTIKDADIRITIHTELLRGLSLVRRWVSVANTGEKSVRLHRALSLMLTLRPGSADPELYWVEAFTHPCVVQPLRRQASVHQERLTPSTRRKILYGPYSRPHDGSQGAMGWLALRDPELNEGMFVGWEWSGTFDAEVGDFNEGAGALGVRCGFSDDGEYRRDLAGGETFDTPVALFGFFRGDVDAAARTPRATAEAALAPPWPSGDGKAPMFVG